MTTVRSDWYIPPATIQAERCFPGIIGEVLAREIKSLAEFTFLGEGSRPARLLTAVQEFIRSAAVAGEGELRQGGDGHFVRLVQM